MKRLSFIPLSLLLFCIGCDKSNLDLNNPDVAIFVKQLKQGTYDYYEKGETGENLWLLMPGFNADHISALIEFAADTTHITNFPVNPCSSRRPLPEGRDYFILGECLLWTVEGIRNDFGYGSLDPYLINTSMAERERYEGLKGDEILIVRSVYKDWWESLKESNWKDKNPLEGTCYRWF